MKQEVNFKGWKDERGNVLFLILIAVALFAALSYAVTQSTRSSGGDAGSETNRINSAQLTQYPASVRTSIVRMVIGGQDVDRIEFNSAGNFANCTENPVGSGQFPRCVFHPTGGGATSLEAPGTLMADGGPGRWIYNGANEIEDIGTSTIPAADGVAANATTADLIAFLPGITLGLCRAINEELGLPTDPIPTEAGIVFTEASDMINPDGATDTSLAGGGESIGFGGNGLQGRPFGCFQQPAGTYVYYHVLVER